MSNDDQGKQHVKEVSVRYIIRGHIQRATVALLCTLMALAAYQPVRATPLEANGCDFNGDGFDDQAIGIPGESIAGVADMGAVQVIYGSGAGLAAAGNQLWDQDVAGVVGAGELSDRFGEAIGCGDFDGDGFDDLAVGVLSEDLPGLVDAGAVQVFYGTGTGLGAAGNQIWTQDSASVPGVAEARDRFGSAVSAGDFDGDGFDDLAVGAPGEAVGEADVAGAVSVLYGGPSGLSAAGSQIFSQDTAGIQGVAEARDLFGASLASGDFNGGGRDDLAIGVPGEDEGDDVRDAGAANVVYGAGGGLTAADDQIFTQQTSGIQGVAEPYDRMGLALVAGNFDGNARDDLAIGAPGEDVGASDESAGAVHVLYGTASGLGAAGDDLFTQDTAGVTGDAEPHDRFGSALAAGDFNGNGRDDLAIGAPWDSVAGEPEIGVVNVLYGTASGIGTGGNQFWHQDQPGVAGQAEALDRLGEALATGDFNGNGRADLAMAVPGDSVAGVSDMGTMNVMYGAAGGLSAAGDQFWHQDTPGVVGDAETRDRLGGRLRSDGVYRVPYEDDTQVRVNLDRLTHAPQQDRIDMSGVNGGSDYTIVAARAGTIQFIVDGNAGEADNNYVWIEHSNGEWSKYTHFATGSVTAAGRVVGEQVSAGTVLGTEGDVGTEDEHLHFEIAVPYDSTDPITGGGFIKGDNRDPVICGIPGNTFIAGQTYTAGPC